jgi:prephenate dehydrogenase
VLCANDHTDDDTRVGAERLVQTLGALAIWVDASEHDRVLARTSHLPQALSSALALSLEPGDLSLSGSGLRDMTRLAASDPTMWRDILVTNADDVVDALRRCSAQLDRLAALMQMGDAAGVAQFVESGRERVAATS